VFNIGSDTAQMKVYLINSAFEVSPYGWAEAQEPGDFGGSSTYQWPLGSIALPNGYDNIPPGTGVYFKISNCVVCDGSVSITYAPVTIP
jgi:hypothetical protein